MAPQNIPSYEGSYEATSAGQPRTGSNGMAIASLVLGIVSLLVLAVITGTLAIVFGGIGLSRVSDRGGKGTVMSWFGISLGALGIVLWVALLVANHGHFSYHVGS